MTLDDAEDRSAAAGEYVLGTLSAPDREAFERALQHDRALLGEVYFWQDRLQHLTALVPPVEPDAGHWAAIEAALAPPATVRHVAQAGAAGLATGDARPAANDAVWRRLRRWQWIGSVAMAASAVLATALGLRLLALPGEPPARYLAVLQAPQDRSTGWVVEVTRGDRVRLIPIGVTPPVPAGKALQFWTKAEGAAGPTSLGLVRAGRTTELAAALLPALEEKQLFELTLEPEAGSPLDRPTGPVLFLGRTVRL